MGARNFLVGLFLLLTLPMTFARAADLFVYSNGANVTGEYDSKLKIFKLCDGEIIEVNVNPKNVRQGAGNCSDENVIAYAPMILKDNLAVTATIKTLDTAAINGAVSNVMAYVGFDTGNGKGSGVSLKISEQTLKKILAIRQVQVTYNKKNDIETLGIGNSKFQKSSGKSEYFQELK